MLDIVKKIRILKNQISKLRREKKKFRAREKILIRKTLKDPLTDILNQAGLYEALKEEMARAGNNGKSEKRRKQNYSFWILMFDIDDFKGVNDAYGHEEGNKVLRNISSILKTRTRLTDKKGRYGGDEFIVIFPQISKKNLKKLVEDIRIEIGKKTNITISIGVIKNESDLNLEQLLKKVDDALYKSKLRGKNSVTFY